MLSGTQQGSCLAKTEAVGDPRSSGAAAGGLAGMLGCLWQGGIRGPCSGI